MRQLTRMIQRSRLSRSGGSGGGGGAVHRCQARILLAHLRRVEQEGASAMLEAVPPVNEIVQFWREEKPQLLVHSDRDDFDDGGSQSLQKDVLELVKFSAKYVIPFLDNDDGGGDNDYREQLECIAGEVFYLQFMKFLKLESNEKDCKEKEMANCVDLQRQSLDTMVELAQGDVIEFLDLARYQLVKQHKAMRPEKSRVLDEVSLRMFIVTVSQFVLDQLQKFSQSTALDHNAESIDGLLSFLFQFNFLESITELTLCQDMQGDTLLDTVQYCLQCPHVNLRWSIVKLLGTAGMASKSTCVHVIPILERFLFFDDAPLRMAALAHLWDIVFVWDHHLQHLSLDIVNGQMISTTDGGDVDGHELMHDAKQNLLGILSDFLNGPLVECQVISAVGICRLLLSDSPMVADCIEQLISELTLKYCTPSRLAEELTAVSAFNDKNRSEILAELEEDVNTEQTLMQVILTFFQEYHKEKTVHQEELANSVVFIVMDMYDRGKLPLTADEQRQLKHNGNRSHRSDFSIFRSQCMLLVSMLQERYIPMVVESVLNNIDSLAMEDQELEMERAEALLDAADEVESERPGQPRVSADLVRMWISPM